MKDSKKTQGVSKLKSEDVEQLESKIAKLEEHIKELALTIDKVEDEKLEITNQLKRALSDYHNLELNTQKRLELLYLQSRKSLAERLIPIADDMSMAIKSKGDIQFDQKALSWVNGVTELFVKLDRSLEEIGIQKYIPEIDSEFDPDKHEALATIPGDKPDVIHEVIQPGYVLDNVVIRPSRVIVTK